MTRTRHTLMAVITTLMVGMGLLSASTISAEAAPRPSATLSTVGSKYVGTPIPVIGYLDNTGARRNKTIYLQRKVGTTWRPAGRLVRRTDGRFRFPNRVVTTPQTVRLRVVVKAKRKTLDVSNTIAVKVKLPPKPDDIVETRADGEEELYCPQLVVRTPAEQRVTTWVWSKTRLVWVRSVGDWKTVGYQTIRAATAQECLDIKDSVPAGAALPDVRMKNLNKCGAGDLARTNGTCFLIEYNNAGRKLLKFAGLTFNVGAGPSEIIADRSAEQAEDWKGYQTFYDNQGNSLGSVYTPATQFYFAGDGHNHWHVRDFDSYEILSADGTTLAHGEKHGYCLQDNTSYGPMEGLPGVPGGDGVYLESTSCGKGLPSALTIVHGLSRGWGDTYPTTLPDQGIDITDLPNGTYTVRVTADAAGAVVESDDSNNTASMVVTITGDTVTTHPETATGGLS